MAWTVIPTTDIDQDSPITQPLMTAIRDNTILANAMITTTDISSVATVDFTAFSATDYDGYFWVLSHVSPATDSVDLLMRTSTDGGATYDASGYAYSGVSRDIGASPTDTLTGSDSASSILLNLNTNNIGNVAGEGFSGIVWMKGPHLVQPCRVHWRGQHETPLSQRKSVSGDGERTAAADVDAVRFLFSSGNLASGTITMYGLGAATG